MDSPWLVNSLAEFLFYCCPECDAKESIEEQFIKHAILKHPEAKKCIGKLLDIKEELDEEEDTFVDNNDFNSEGEEENDFQAETFDDNTEIVNKENLSHLHYMKPENEVKEEILDDLVVCDTNAEIANSIEVDTDRNYEYECDFCEHGFSKHELLARHLQLFHNQSVEYDEEPNVNKNLTKKSQKFTVTKHSSDVVHENQKYENFCHTCGKSFNRPSDLKIHVYTVHDGHKDFHCNSCEKSFSSSSGLTKHFKSVHEGLKEHHCDSCGKSFSRQDHLKQHIYVVHEGNKDYQCASCEKSFGNSSDLKKHVSTIHEGRKDYFCGPCEKWFSRAEHLKRHNINVHNAGTKVKQCIICTRCFSSESELEKHVQKHIKFKCDTCEKTFCRSESLIQHKSKTHNDGHKCETCGKLFAEELKLKKHKFLQHQGWRQNCNTCGKSFSDDLKLNQHMKKFHELVSVKCEICGKSFIDDIKLNQHMNKFHERVKENRQCETCGKSFSDDMKLNQHKKKFHERVKDNRQCDTCGKSFHKPHELRRHIYTVHEGHKDFYCELCDKFFTERKNLKKHIKIVSTCSIFQLQARYYR